MQAVAGQTNTGPGPGFARGLLGLVSEERDEGAGVRERGSGQSVAQQHGRQDQHDGCDGEGVLVGFHHCACLVAWSVSTLSL